MAHGPRPVGTARLAHGLMGRVGPPICLAWAGLGRHVGSVNIGPCRAIGHLYLKQGQSEWETYQHVRKSCKPEETAKAGGREHGFGFPNM